MKKLLLSVAIIASGLTINAQEIKFGAKAGLNISNISSDDFENNAARTSFHVGAVAEIEISDKFSVQPELLYSAQGATASQEGIDVTMALDYLNVPVMAKYYVAEGFSLEVGPQIGFLMSAKMKEESGKELERQNIKDDLKSIDFGMNFGAGYKLENGLNFSARYNLGLSNIAEESENSVKNGVFQVSVGYSF